MSLESILAEITQRAAPAPVQSSSAAASSSPKDPTKPSKMLLRSAAFFMITEDCPPNTTKAMEDAITNLLNTDAGRTAVRRTPLFISSEILENTGFNLVSSDENCDLLFGNETGLQVKVFWNGDTSVVAVDGKPVNPTVDENGNPLPRTGRKPKAAATV